MANVIEALRYMIGASWEGESDVKRASGSIRGLGDETARVEQKSKVAWANIGKAVAGVGVAFGGAMIAGKQLYAALGEGADLLRAEDQFSRLAESIDSTADSMMGRLREATNGMVADAELVQSATQIMSLGLQDTEDGVVRLSAVAGKLGWDMSQVILTMANDSVMRLDALGLSIDNVANKQSRLISEGFSKGQAFDLAVIEAGEEKIELLGDAAETTAGQMAMLEAGVANAQNEFKIELTRGFAEGLSEISGSATQASSDLQILTGAVGEFLGKIGGGIVGEFAQQISAKDIVEKSVQLGLMSESYANSLMQRAKGRGADPTHELELAQQRLEYYYAHANALHDSWTSATVAGDREVVESTRRVISAIDGVPVAMDPAGRAMSRYGEFAFQGAGSSEKMALVLERLPGLLTGSADAAWLAAGGIGALGDEADPVAASIKALNDELDRLSGANVEAHITLSEQVRRYFDDPGAGNYDNNAMGAAARNQGGVEAPPTAAPSSPVGGGRGPSTPQVTVNAYNERTAALVVTMLQQQMRNNGAAL